MIRYICLPIEWFTDEISKDVCSLMGLPVCKVVDWFTLEHTYSLLLPDDFHPLAYLKEDKIHAIVFKNSDESLNGCLFHPEALRKLNQKELRKQLRRDGISRLKIIKTRFPGIGN